MRPGFYGGSPDMFLNDEEIVEQQHDDARSLIDQIRRCGTLYYESELPSPHWAWPSEGHPDVSKPQHRRKLPVKVIDPPFVPYVDPVTRIMHQLQDLGHLPSLRRCPMCHEYIGAVLTHKPVALCLPQLGPCDHCRDLMFYGILMIEVKGDGSNTDARGSGWCVANEVCVMHIFKDEPSLLQNVLKERGVFVTTATWNMLHLPRGRWAELPEEYQPTFGGEQRNEDLHQAALHL